MATVTEEAINTPRDERAQLGVLIFAINIFAAVVNIIIISLL